MAGRRWVIRMNISINLSRIICICIKNHQCTFIWTGITQNAGCFCWCHFSKSLLGRHKERKIGGEKPQSSSRFSFPFLPPRDACHPRQLFLPQRVRPGPLLFLTCHILTPNIKSPSRARERLKNVWITIQFI